jgi:hypothetical protein
MKGAGNPSTASQPLILAQYKGTRSYGPAAQRWGPAARGYYAPNRNYRTYRGYRGYPYYRPGYRRYNGWWYPSAAFALGAILGGALAAPSYNYNYGYSEAHHRWCDARYRSYRWSDGTFQPYNGPRRRCNSPYDGV